MLVEKGIVTDSELEMDPATTEESLAANVPHRLSPNSRHVRAAKMYDDDDDDDLEGL
jgi:hypothetical protein